MFNYKATSKCFHQFNVYMYLQTFQANTDTDTVVENQLPIPVTARCLRLYPLEWDTLPDVKMEVYGCSSV